MYHVSNRPGRVSYPETADASFVYLFQAIEFCTAGCVIYSTADDANFCWDTFQRTGAIYWNKCTD